MNEKNSAVKTCSFCGAETYRLSDDVLKMNGKHVLYHVCQKCFFTTKDKDFWPTPSEEKKQYDFHQNHPENEGYVNMFKRFIALAVDPFISTGTALDFGSGPGPVLASMLEKKGFNTECYDLFYTPNKNVFNKQYDLITATEVFEHLHHPLTTIETIIKMMKPGGILAVMTSFRSENDVDFLNWWYRRDATHIAFYTLKTMRVILKKFPLQLLTHNHKNIIVFQKELI